MGKLDGQLGLPIPQAGEAENSRRGRNCGCCWDRVRKELSFKCVVFSILSLGVFLSALFWLLPRHSVKYGFDARVGIKNSAVIQGYFVLDKPVASLIPHIQKLEYDVIGEIGVPNSRVAILSMHEHSASNYTNVVFGVIPDPINIQIDPVALSLLKSSLIDLFLKLSNLTFTSASVGQASHFEILKFPGKITVIPVQSAAIWQIQQTLFNFTLNNSISDVQEYFVDFRDQLKKGLRLAPYENVYVQVTNEDGSTVDEPVIVQVAIMSDLGRLLPQRLRQLAQTIRYSAPSKNLGLNNTVFGKVKGVSLSSHMSGDVQTDPPRPSPAPAPALGHDYSPAPTPAPIGTQPSYSPSPISVIPTVPPLTPIVDPRVQPSHAPTPQFFPNNPTTFPPRGTPHPVKNSLSPLPSTLSPLPSVSFGSDPGQHDDKGISPSHGPSPEIHASASTKSVISKELTFYCLIMSSLFCWFC